MVYLRTVLLLFASVLSLGASAINVSSVATAGNGSVGSPWTGWDTAITWVGDQQYNFPGGVYAYAVSPNFLKAGLALVGEAGTILKHTGSGNAVVFDNVDSWTFGVRMENFKIQGNSGTTNGLFLRGVRNSSFRNITVYNVTGAGIWTEACVTNVLDNFRISELENSFTVTPQYGIVFTSRATVASHESTTWSVINPVVEGTSKVGIWLRATYGNTIINGTAEHNHGKGMVIDGHLNTVINTDFESNNGDVAVNSNENILVNLFAEHTTDIATSQNNQLIGGRHKAINISNIAGPSVMLGVNYTGLSNPGSGTIRIGNLGTGDWFNSHLFNVIAPSRQSNFAASVDTDARVGDFFYFIAYDNFTLANPVGPSDGQTITWRISQNPTGTAVMSFGSKFRAKPGQPFPVLGNIPNGSNYIRATYAAWGDTWDIQ